VLDARVVGEAAAVPAYMGTPSATAAGTVHHASFPMKLARKPSGTQPWMNAPAPMPARMNAVRRSVLSRRTS
jgi:hypothetical protein